MRNIRSFCKADLCHGLALLPTCLYMRVIRLMPVPLCRYCEALYRINHTSNHRFDDLVLDE